MKNVVMKVELLMIKMTEMKFVKYVDVFKHFILYLMKMK